MILARFLSGSGARLGYRSGNTIVRDDPIRPAFDVGDVVLRPPIVQSAEFFQGVFNRLPSRSAEFVRLESSGAFLAIQDGT